jgi:hypothetical protein
MRGSLSLNSLQINWFTNRTQKKIAPPDKPVSNPFKILLNRVAKNPIFGYIPFESILEAPLFWRFCQRRVKKMEKNSI